MKKKATKPSSKVTSKQQKEEAIQKIAEARVKDPHLDHFLWSETKIDELEAEITKYHEWCLEWRRLNDGLEEELKRTQFMLMDAQAVIVYLENKLGVGV